LAGVLEHPPTEGKAKMRTLAATPARREFTARENDEARIIQDLTAGAAKSERQISDFPK
jgi:hypothetical protein